MKIIAMTVGDLRFLEGRGVVEGAANGSHEVGMCIHTRGEVPNESSHAHERDPRRSNHDSK